MKENIEIIAKRLQLSGIFDTATAVATLSVGGYFLDAITDIGIYYAIALVCVFSIGLLFREAAKLNSDHVRKEFQKKMHEQAAHATAEIEKLERISAEIHANAEQKEKILKQFTEQNLIASEQIEILEKQIENAEKQIENAEKQAENFEKQSKELAKQLDFFEKQNQDLREKLEKIAFAEKAKETAEKNGWSENKLIAFFEQQDKDGLTPFEKYVRTSVARAQAGAKGGQK